VSSVLLGLFDDLNPQLQRQILALWSAKLVPKFGFVSAPERACVEARSDSNRFNIGSVTVAVSRELRQDEIVPLEYLQPEILERATRRQNQALVVPIRNIGDCHDVNEHLVPSVKLAAAPCEFGDVGQIGALALEDVDVRGRSRQAVAFSDNESAEAMKLRRDLEFFVELP